MFTFKCKISLKYSRLQNISNFIAAVMQLVSRYKFSNLWLMNNNCENFCVKYEGWNFNSGNYLFTTDTK